MVSKTVVGCAILVVAPPGRHVHLELAFELIRQGVTRETIADVRWPTRLPAACR